MAGGKKSKSDKDRKRKKGGRDSAVGRTVRNKHFFIFLR